MFGIEIIQEEYDGHKNKCHEFATEELVPNDYMVTTGGSCGERSSRAA